MKEEKKATYRILYLPCEDLEGEVNRIADDGYHIIYMSDVCIFFQKDVEWDKHLLTEDKAGEYRVD